MINIMYKKATTCLFLDVQKKKKKTPVRNTYLWNFVPRFPIGTTEVKRKGPRLGNVCTLPGRKIKN